jgi:hypothetical protein
MITVLAATAATATLGITGVANAAAGDKTFQQTYPVASTLCANVAANKEHNAHVRRHAARVLIDCATLQASFTAAQAAVLAARAALTPQINADNAAIAAACPPPSKPPTAMCTITRHADETAIDVLTKQMTAARHRYFVTIEAARVRFWNAVRSLPGLHHLHGDGPIVPQSS